MTFDLESPELPEKEITARGPYGEEPSPIETGEGAEELPLREILPEEPPAGEGAPPAAEAEEFEALARKGRRPPPRERGPRKGAGLGGFTFLSFLIIGAAAVTLAITIAFTRPGKIDYSNFGFWVVIFALCAIFEIRLKGGLTLNLGLAALLGAMIVIPAVEVAWLFVLGTIIASFVTLFGEFTKERLMVMLLDFTGVGIASVVFRFFVKVLPDKPMLHGNYWPGILVSIGLAAGILFLIYAVRSTYLLSQEGQFPFNVYFTSIVRRSWLAFLVVGFTGVLMGLIFIGIGMWSVLFALPLLLVFRYSYNRVAASDQSLLETIRTLAAIPEETGMIEPGHGRRVAELAEGVAQELGLPPEDVKQVEYAAYLHDIGAIIKETGVDEQRQLLEVEGVIAGGVDIVGKVEYLEVAAEILRGREGLRDRVADVDKRRAVSMGAGILKAVDDFESMVMGSEDRGPVSESDALTEMNLERGVMYDSKVLRAIARVLPRLSREGLDSAGRTAESSAFWGEP